MVSTSTLMALRCICNDGVSRCSCRASCWEWEGDKTKTGGYGRVMIGTRRYRVHRVSAMLFLGFDINSPLLVCHTCDNPPCWNPSHLFIGTDKDNSEDKIKKMRGNHARGEKQALAKLTERDVCEIRSRFKDCPETYRTIAKRFGVDYGTIRAVIVRRTWKHLP
jgi:hypothetical protein